MVYYWLVSTMYVHTTGLNLRTIQDSWILQVGHSRGIPCYPHPPHSHYPAPLPAFPSVRSRAKNCAFGGLKPPETSIVWYESLPSFMFNTPQKPWLVGILHHLLRPSKVFWIFGGWDCLDGFHHQYSILSHEKSPLHHHSCQLLLTLRCQTWQNTHWLRWNVPTMPIFHGGFPASHAWWSHQSLIHPLFVIQLASSSQVRPRAEEKTAGFKLRWGQNETYSP